MFAAFRRTRRPARGFSLIELGIVIAVIAVLASVVIFGRGFITAGRISKTVEGINTIRKAGAAFAGLHGGSIKTSTASEIPAMRDRSLLPVKAGQTTWLVAGDTSNPFTVTDIRFGVHQKQQSVGIRMTTPDPVQAEDLYNSVLNDPNFINDGTQVGGVTCSSAKPTAANVVLCFHI